MPELPRGFPEYSIMYKTILKKINELTNEIKNSQKNDISDIEKKIRDYKSELNRIKEKFPEGFFDKIFEQK